MYQDEVKATVYTLALVKRATRLSEGAVWYVLKAGLAEAQGQWNCNLGI